METAAWTIGDLAHLTSKAVETHFLTIDLDDTVLNSGYCERCSVVETSEQYCDGCVRDIVAWLQASDENYKAGKGLY